MPQRVAPDDDTLDGVEGLRVVSQLWPQSQVPVFDTHEVMLPHLHPAAREITRVRVLPEGFRVPPAHVRPALSKDNKIPHDRLAPQQAHEALPCRKHELIRFYLPVRHRRLTPPATALSDSSPYRSSHHGSVTGVDIVEKAHHLLAPGGRAYLMFYRDPVSAFQQMGIEAPPLAGKPDGTVHEDGYDVIEFIQDGD